MMQHKANLLYSEVYPDKHSAATRERQIKGWSRKKKLSLINDQRWVYPERSRRESYPRSHYNHGRFHRPFFVMEHWVYILQSQSTCRYYCGQTTDLPVRLSQHIDPYNDLFKTTKRCKDHFSGCVCWPPINPDFMSHLFIYKAFIDIRRRGYFGTASLCHSPVLKRAVEYNKKVNAARPKVE